MIALVVNALYNIVDQIFIGWGGGYLGNGATNIVFPITIIALAFAVPVGDGGAAYLSLKLGEGDSESVKKGLGNAIVMVTAPGVLILIIFLALMNPILALFGATDALLSYAQDYGYIIAIGLPFTMISTALNAMIRVDVSPKYAMLSMLLGAVINVIFDPIFIFVFKMGVGGAAIETVMGQVVPFIVSVVYIPRFKTLHFELSSLRLSGKVCGNILALGVSSFITQIAITIVMVLFNNLLKQYGAESVYGSEIPITTMGIAMKVNQKIVFLIPVAVVLPIYMGVTGVLWAGPVADGLAFILAFILIGFEIKKLNHMPAAAELNSENPQENAQGDARGNAQEETQENTVQITSENAKEELGKSLQEVSYEEQSHHDQP